MSQQPDTLDSACRWLAARLSDAGIADARRDARLLVAHALGLEPQRLLIDGDRLLGSADLVALEAVAARRCAREPVSRIIGSRGFWTLDLTLTPDTLDPRPDTETLVEAVLAARPDRQAPLRMLDFGTGSGCILLALLSEYPAAQGLGIDIAPGAVAAAEANARRNGLDQRARFQCGNWAEGLSGPFDVIVSNPPYITDAEMAGLEPEVTRYDPPRALVSGPSGLEDYQRLIPALPALLAPGGLVALEVGHTQAQAVSALLVASGFDAPWTRQDLGGIARCVVAESHHPEKNDKKA